MGVIPVLRRTNNMWQRKDMLHDIIECLVASLEAKDIYTSGHSTRVAHMSLDLAKAVGLKGKDLENIHIAGHLHDIGKIGVPEQVLNKPGKLLPHEWAQIMAHPEIGYKILSKSKKLDLISKIVLHHHERWDGKGYPGNLKGEKIPLGARIIGICDSLDAMTSQRPYRAAFTFTKAYQEIVNNKGLQFDPVLVDMVEKLWPKWEQQYWGKNEVKFVENF